MCFHFGAGHGFISMSETVEFFHPTLFLLNTSKIGLNLFEPEPCEKCSAVNSQSAAVWADDCVLTLCGSDPAHAGSESCSRTFLSSHEAANEHNLLNGHISNCRHPTCDLSITGRSV